MMCKARKVSLRVEEPFLAQWHAVRTHLTALAPGGLDTAEETAPVPAGELGRGASALMKEKEEMENEWG